MTKLSNSIDVGDHSFRLVSTTAAMMLVMKPKADRISLMMARVMMILLLHAEAAVTELGTFKINECSRYLHTAFYEGQGAQYYKVDFDKKIYLGV